MSYKMKDLPLEEKPREKALLYGFKNLTDAELLAILLRTGSKEKNAKELALDILKENENIHGIENSKISYLANIKGVGKTKAITILAALELGKRLENTNSLDFDDLLFKDELENQIQEKFMVVFLNNSNEIIDHKILFLGTINQSLIDPKVIFKEALLYSANKIIVLHNHPSGNTTPSKEDYNITDNLIQICRLFNIVFLDHLIIGKNKYFSFYSYIRKVD